MATTNVCTVKEAHMDQREVRSDKQLTTSLAGDTIKHPVDLRQIYVYNSYRTYHTSVQFALIELLNSNDYFHASHKKLLWVWALELLLFSLFKAFQGEFLLSSR